MNKRPFLMAQALSAALLLGAAAANAQEAPGDTTIPDPIEVTDPVQPPPGDDVVVTDPVDPPPADDVVVTDPVTPAPGGDVVVTDPVAPPAAPLPQAVQSLERNLQKNPGNPGLTNALDRVRANHGVAAPGADIMRVEAPQRVEKPQRVERVERIERVEKVERIDRPQRVDRPDRPERGNGRN